MKHALSGEPHSIQRLEEAVAGVVEDGSMAAQESATPGCDWRRASSPGRQNPAQLERGSNRCVRDHSHWSRPAASRTIRATTVRGSATDDSLGAQ